MRQPSYMPDQDQLIKDFHGCADLDDVAPDAVSITVDEYLNPQDVCHRRSSPTDVELMSSVCTFRLSIYLVHRYHYGWRFSLMVLTRWS